jgi:hypothetical protein
MPLATPLTTFGDLARGRPEIEVTCGNCGIDVAAPRLRNRKVARSRFRCEQWALVRLPTIGKQRRRPGRLADQGAFSLALGGQTWNGSHHIDRHKT